MDTEPTEVSASTTEAPDLTDALAALTLEDFSEADLETATAHIAAAENIYQLLGVPSEGDDADYDKFVQGLFDQYGNEPVNALIKADAAHRNAKERAYALEAEAKAERDRLAQAALAGRHVPVPTPKEVAASAPAPRIVYEPAPEEAEPVAEMSAAVGGTYGGQKFTKMTDFFKAIAANSRIVKSVVPTVVGTIYTPAKELAASCIPPQPDYSVNVCGVPTLDYLEFFSTHEAPPQGTSYRRPRATPTGVVNQWDGGTKVCTTYDSCGDVFLSGDIVLDYLCNTIKNEDQWADMLGVEANFLALANAWTRHANGTAWKYVKDHSLKPAPVSGAPAVELFNKAALTNLAYFVDQTYRTRNSDLVIMIQAPLADALGIDESVRNMHFEDAAQAELADQFKLITRHYPNIRFVIARDVAELGGGSFYSTIGDGQPIPLPTNPAFAIAGVGDFSEAVLAEMSLGFGPEDVGRVRGGEEVRGNVSVAFLERKVERRYQGCLSLWQEVVTCTTGADPEDHATEDCAA